MPELPEVETIRRELMPGLINQKIVKCVVLRRDIVAYPEPKKFCRMLSREIILDVQRQGKYLILKLTGDKRLIFHLRLSGSIILAKPEMPPEKFTRILLKTSDRQVLFNEPRALGRVYLIKGNEQPHCLKGFFNLGYEPISPEFDFQYFKGILKNRKARIKAILLDQHFCAGVGNIYSDEALFQAGIRPLRRAYTLSTDEVFKLLLSLKKVLNKAIKYAGTTVSDYKRIDGKKGDFQKFLYVYDREGEPCRVCGTKIKITKLGNRGTRYCPKCQR